MKIRNIFGLGLALSLVFASACTEKDMSMVDEWLGEKFNQEILWDVDSMAFRRADWKMNDVVNGVQIRQSSIKMWGSVQSISFITYSPNTFNTYLGYTGEEGTVADIAGSYEGALFAINAGSLVDGKPADYFKLDGEVITSENSSADANGIIGLTVSPLGVSANVSINLDASEYTSAMVTGPVLLTNGEEREFPEGEFYDTRMARTIFGVTDAGNYVMGVIDGGADGQADGATVKEAAFVARLMGLKSAILLGCGDQTSVWSADKGVLNAPSAGSAQKTGTVIYVGAGTSRVSGSGTAAEPYLIENHVHMTQIRALSKENAATYFRLENDIDMSAVKIWTPTNFDGEFSRQVHFDGNGKTISNFAPTAFVADDQTTAATYPSLFGVLYGSCKDLTITDSKIIVSYTTPSCGFLGGFVGTTGKPATVENVHISGEIHGGSNIGAFGGQSRESTFKNCTADIKITSGGTDAGGVVGKSGVSIHIEDVDVKVDITPTDALSGNQRHAGILGYSTGTSMVIKNCKAEGVIRHCANSTKTTGGINAYAGAETCEITNCSSSVVVTGSKIANSGGICGIASPAVSITIENCCSSGETYPGQQFGGMIGRTEKGAAVIRNCYSIMDIHGYSGNGGLFGVNTAAACSLEIVNSFAWNAVIEASRETADKYSSGAMIGSAACPVTVSGSFRNPNMSFADAFRSLETHGDCSAKTLDGAANQMAYDSTPSAEATLTAAAKKAGWSSSVWDFSGDVPVLK